MSRADTNSSWDESEDDTSFDSKEAEVETKLITGYTFSGRPHSLMFIKAGERLGEYQALLDTGSNFPLRLNLAQVHELGILKETNFEFKQAKLSGQYERSPFISIATDMKLLFPFKKKEINETYFQHVYVCSRVHVAVPGFDPKLSNSKQYEWLTSKENIAKYNVLRFTTVGIPVLESVKGGVKFNQKPRENYNGPTYWQINTKYQIVLNDKKIGEFPGKNRRGFENKFEYNE
jgi:hypothetical protein